MELAVAMGLTGEATAATVITGSKSGFSESRTSDFSTFFAGRFAAGRFEAGLEEASLLLAVVFLVDFFGMSVSLLH